MKGERIFLKRKGFFDYNLLIVVLFLLCFGLIMLYSASAYDAQATLGSDMYYLIRQGLIGAAGFGIMLLVSRINYHVYGQLSFLVYAGSILLMALVRWSPLGVESYGARRWLSLPGGFTLQPSEIAKVAVILFIPYLLCKAGREVQGARGFLRILGPGALIAVSVYYLTDNLSTAIIVLGITGILFFVVHPRTAPFVAALTAFLVVAFVGLRLLASSLSDSSNFRLRRILAWLNPEEFATEESHQVTQALYAIGSGGFFGKGLGNSTQKLVIPEVQNDMILSVVAEELGVFGVLVLMTLFGILLYRLLHIARNAPDMYGSLIATGIFSHIALQVILNVAVVTRVLPTTGITLPFISYGGTSIVFLLVEMGIALGISRTIRPAEEAEREQEGPRPVRLGRIR